MRREAGGLAEPSRWEEGDRLPPKRRQLNGQPDRPCGLLPALADWLLPHLVGRPVTQVRYPEGGGPVLLSKRRFGLPNRRASPCLRLSCLRLTSALGNCAWVFQFWTGSQSRWLSFWISTRSRPPSPSWHVRWRKYRCGCPGRPRLLLRPEIKVGCISSFPGAGGRRFPKLRLPTSRGAGFSGLGAGLLDF